MKSLLAKSCFFMLFLTCTFLAIAQQGNVSAGGDIGGSGGTMSFSVGQVGYRIYTSVEGSISFGLQHPWFETGDEPPPFLDVPGTTIGSGEDLCFNATGTVILGGSGKEFVVEAGGHADIIAGEKILLKYGTRVEAGGSLHARISTEWCFPDDERHLHPLAIVYDDATTAEAPPTTQANESLHDPSAYGSRFAFNVYPNPGRGIYAVELATDNTTMPASISIHSMMGELITTVENTFDQPIIISITDAKPGIYLLRVSHNNQVGTQKIIKQY